jgi:hypothetical protein
MKLVLVCPWCQASLDDDSWFCDQCGKELYVCPRCNTLRKGKVCTQDGTTLIPLKDRSAYSSAGSAAPETDQPVSPLPASGSSAVIPTNIGSRQAPSALQPQAGTEQEELVLINRNLGLNLVIRPGDIIGRKEGRFSDVFQGYKSISRRHCLFNYEPGKGWTVTDLGSTNGVDYEGKRIQPYQPQPLRSRSFLVIGNIEFFVEIRGHSSVDQTERVR